MTDRLVAEIEFAPDFPSPAPGAPFVVEAHLGGQATGPWSMRCEPWSASNDLDCVLAWVSFLSPDAPFEGLPLGEPFVLTLGPSEVGKATLKVFPRITTTHEENDFASYPSMPVRKRAA